MGGGGGSSRDGWAKSRKKINYPGNNPAIPPGLGFEWRGRGRPGSKGGNWYNPDTKEKWNPDLEHATPIGPHWDYRIGKGPRYRVFSDGRVERKKENGEEKNK